MPKIGRGRPEKTGLQTIRDKAALVLSKAMSEANDVASSLGHGDCELGFIKNAMTEDGKKDCQLKTAITRTRVGVP